MADKPLVPYLAAAAPVVARTRQLFPAAVVSVIGCFGLSWDTCAPALRQAYANGSAHRLFDAVTIHNYGPDNDTITAHACTDADRRCVTLAAVRPVLFSMARRVSTGISPTVPIWLDEFNWGGSWSGKVTWPAETHGALRGLLWAAYVLSAIVINDGLHAAGPATESGGGFASLMYYSLFYQASSPWSHWASCASVPDAANSPGAVRFDGVAQVIAHVTHVAFQMGYADVAAVVNVTTASIPAELHIDASAGNSCVIAVRFTHADCGDSASSGSGGVEAVCGNSTIVALNMCPAVAVVTRPLGTAGGTLAAWEYYSGFDTGGWVLASVIGSLASPPWSNGPLLVHTGTTAAAPLQLPPVSLSLLHYAAVAGDARDVQAQ